MSQAGVDHLVKVVKEVGRIVFFLHLYFTCESLHVRAVCTWHCEHARFCVEFVFMRCLFHSSLFPSSSWSGFFF